MASQTAPAGGGQPTADDQAQAGYLTTGFWTGFSANNPPPHRWASGVTINVALDPSSDFTPVEADAVRNALALWSDAANVTFSLEPLSNLGATQATIQQNAAAYGSAGIRITRGTDRQAHTAVSYYPNTAAANGGYDVLSQATVSIDTSAPSFADLSSLGGADQSGYGGYGFLTLVHEIGHALGLGHAGPYNGYASPATDHVLANDSRQYTVMSYFNPNQVGGTAGYVAAGGMAYYDSTPMLDDVLAVQSIYGASTTAPAGVTFGFNASAGLPREFDFTLNTVPIVTLVAGGPGSANTLDLSGWSTPDTINLNPGGFSSCDGLTANICIGYGTAIDNAVGGSGANTFVVNAEADTITGNGGSNTVVFPDALGAYTVTQSGPSVLVSSGGVTDTLTDVQTLQFADTSLAAPAPVCFAEGTRILTPDGEVPVERLRVGMRVTTARPGSSASIIPLPVIWIGRRRLDLARCADRDAVAPVVIAADAIAPGVPTRALRVSPDHALLIDGLLIPARLLLNGGTIRQDSAARRVTYFHVELPGHAVLLAEGLAAESYMDTGNRAFFAEQGAPPLPRPSREDAAETVLRAARACAPFATDPARVLPVWQRLGARAAALGRLPPAPAPVTTDPDLIVQAAGRTLRPVRSDGWFSCALPRPGSGQELAVRIRSRAARPAALRPWIDDRRALGVAVGRVRWRDGAHDEDIALDSPALGGGWWPVEQRDGRTWRWTAGDAVVHLPARASVLAFELMATAEYLLAT